MSAHFTVEVGVSVFPVRDSVAQRLVTGQEHRGAALLSSEGDCEERGKTQDIDGRKGSQHTRLRSTAIPGSRGLPPALRPLLVREGGGAVEDTSRACILTHGGH